MLAILGLLVALAGLLFAVVCGLWFTLETFNESLLWGLACLFIPFASLVFLVAHWDRAAKPFLFSLAGVGVMMFGQLVAAVGGA
jgi:hypothetical protein